MTSDDEYFSDAYLCLPILYDQLHKITADILTILVHNHVIGHIHLVGSSNHSLVLFFL